MGLHSPTSNSIAQEVLVCTRGLRELFGSWLTPYGLRRRQDQAGNAIVCRVCSASGAHRLVPLALRHCPRQNVDQELTAAAVARVVVQNANKSPSTPPEHPPTHPLIHHIAFFPTTLQLENLAGGRAGVRLRTAADVCMWQTKRSLLLFPVVCVIHIEVLPESLLSASYCYNLAIGIQKLRTLKVPVPKEVVAFVCRLLLRFGDLNC